MFPASSSNATFRCTLGDPKGGGLGSFLRLAGSSEVSCPESGRSTMNFMTWPVVAGLANSDGMSSPGNGSSGPSLIRNKSGSRGQAGEVYDHIGALRRRHHHRVLRYRSRQKSALGADSPERQGGFARPYHRLTILRMTKRALQPFRKRKR